MKVNRYKGLMILDIGEDINISNIINIINNYYDFESYIFFLNDQDDLTVIYL